MLNKHHFTDLDEYVKNRIGVSLENLVLLSDERVWAMSRWGGMKNYTDFMKELRVGFKKQLPANTLALQTSFVMSLMYELLYGGSGHYVYLEKLLDGDSPFPVRYIARDTLRCARTMI